MFVVFTIAHVYVKCQNCVCSSVHEFLSVPERSFWIFICAIFVLVDYIIKQASQTSLLSCAWLLHLSPRRTLSQFYGGYRYFCTCFLQHLHKVLCCYSGIDLHFSNQSTFVSRRQNTSPSWVVWRLRGPMVFILAYYCLYKWTWYLQAFGNCSQGWTRLVEVYNLFSEVLAD